MHETWVLRTKLDGVEHRSESPTQEMAIRKRDALLASRREKVGKNKWRTYTPLGWTAITRKVREGA